MKLHNLCRWAHENKTGILCAVAAIIATVLLIVCFVVIGGKKDAKAEESTAPAVLPEVEPPSEPAASCLPVWTPDQAEVKPEEVLAIARTLYAECRGVASTAERAAVAWCILNRVDDPRYPDTVLGVVEQPYQFAYSADAPVWQSLKELAMDVLTRYYLEQSGVTDVGRTLPAEYLYFEGDGERNWFTIEWKSDAYWDWSLPDPYGEEN